MGTSTQLRTFTHHFWGYTPKLAITPGSVPFSNRMNPNGHSVNLRADNRKTTKTPLMELRDMQRVLYDAVMSDETETRDKAQAARAYDALEARRAVLRMRPAPKPIDVSQRRKPKPAAHQDPIVPG